MRLYLSRRLVAISKPRCGSTSLRRMLDRFVSQAEGDLRVNTPQDVPGFHPHVTAPALVDQMRTSRGIDISGFDFFTTTRHPVELLWSYYKFFRPDHQSRYTFSPGWEEGLPMEFQAWVLHGRVGMHPDWAARVPAWVSDRDLSPLSLEAHAEDRDGRDWVPNVFGVTEMDRLAAWLGEKTGLAVQPVVSNASPPSPPPALSPQAMAKVVRMFPRESALHGL